MTVTIEAFIEKKQLDDYIKTKWKFGNFFTFFLDIVPLKNYPNVTVLYE